MPILYDQPGAFAPSISSAYGAAQQFSQDAPTIAGLAQHTAQLTQQGLGRADQLQCALRRNSCTARTGRRDRRP